MKDPLCQTNIDALAAQASRVAKRAYNTNTQADATRIVNEALVKTARAYARPRSFDPDTLAASIMALAVRYHQEGKTREQATAAIAELLKVNA